MPPPPSPRPWPLGMRPEDASDYVGGARNLAVLEAFFGLKKTVSHHRNTTYSKDRIDHAFRRADAEGWPTPEQIAAKLQTRSASGSSANNPA